MRKIGFSPYRDGSKEILPKTYMINQRHIQRKMFFTLINSYLGEDAKIPLQNRHLFKKDLFSIFIDKIQSYFQFYKFRPEKPQKIVRIYTHESLLFHQFFKQCKDAKARYITKNYLFNSNFEKLLGYSHPAAELIQLIFNGKEVKMMLELNKVFTHTVYERIKREANKKITLDMPYIHINQDGITTRLHPRWKHVNPKNLQRRENDIEDGFLQLEGEEIDQYYLVYPKTDTFKRHIKVENESLQHLKMIPYSFTFCNRSKKQCKK
ncbi:MAG: hypothetical protein U9P71_01920 [Campylobacterota bacterium]|nr:hypothetical protein [Campylobacterota bacterium]